jgi:hypothetical protein
VDLSVVVSAAGDLSEGDGNLSGGILRADDETDLSGGVWKGKEKEGSE